MHVGRTVIDASESRGVAVIGADPRGRGFGARAHVPAVLALAGFHLAAVGTAREVTAAAAAQRWGAPRAYADYHHAISDETVDIVTVAVKVGLHAEIVEAALAAGKPVYCEWPLALNSDEAARLAQAARARKIATAVGTQGRFAPAFKVAKELLDRGDVGRPLSFQAGQLLPRFPVESNRAWLAREEEGSGALHVATAHVTDTVQHVLGPIASLCGMRATLAPADTYRDTGAPFAWSASDTVTYLSRLASGVVGTTHVANIATPGVGFFLRIQCEDGQLLLTAPGYVSFTPVRLQRGRAGETGFTDVPVEFPSHIALDPSDAGFNVALALEALNADELAFRPGFDDALDLHRVIEAIARSSDERAWVDL